MKKIVILLFTLFYSVVVFASPFKQIVVIGDSLSDNGRLYETLKKIIPKSPPYYKGRFSNGPTWAEIVGKQYYDRAYVDTQIYAWGGATAVLHNPQYDSFIAPITLDGELYNYFTHSLFTDKSKVLYIIWIGANDYLYDHQPNIDHLTDRVVDKISASINTLINQGGRYFLILNLPDLKRTPYARNHGTGERLHDLTVMHNKKLAEAIQKLSRTHSNVKLLSMDIYQVFSDLLSHPEQFNQLYGTSLANITEACWKGGMTQSLPTISSDLNLGADKHNPNFDTDALSHHIQSSPGLALAYSMSKAYEQGIMPCGNAQQYVFWDELHPTEVVHSILGQMVVKKLDAVL